MRFMIRYLVIIALQLLVIFNLVGQNIKQSISGIVLDADSKKPLQNVHILCESCIPSVGSVSDSTGNYRLVVPVGRHNLILSHIRYNSKSLTDVRVVSGKATILSVELTERVVLTEEVSVRGTENRWLNPMATVSARSLRSQDAERYAGGYFDPLRMVTNFAGVASGKSDDNNEIIVRGNSPRGILWRMEGIEIPNPNHFSSGKGASGGGFSSITTNMLSSFDFFTGSFPAEYGNAYSGVMDLNLKTPASDKQEFSLGLSVLGVEASAEGPLNKRKNFTYMANFRLADFNFLSKYNIIDTEDMGIIPKSKDWVFKTSLKTQKAGTFDFFSIGGASLVGDQASTSEEIKTGGDNDEFIEEHITAVAGLKHSILLKNQKTYIKTTVGFTHETNSDKDNRVDTLSKKTITYYDIYKYPAIRAAAVVNHKLNTSHTLRTGFNFNYVWGDLFAHRLNKTTYDTLVNMNVSGWYSGYYLQWKYKSAGIFETNTGIHFLHSGINNEFIAEPRFGVIMKILPGRTINAGIGFHSRLEPLSIYNYRVRITGTKREMRNASLKTIKAFHLTLGYNHRFSSDLTLNAEAYYQFLYDIPESAFTNNSFSIINSSYGLPDIILTNGGVAKNKGVEFTLEKSFSHNYFFLANASFFDSKFRSNLGLWYNTYYNSNYVYNVLGGKDFIVGKNKRNIISLQIRSMFRGGFRYTPVDYTSTLKNKRMIYDITNLYSKRLPGFNRFDLGLSYRLNNKKSSWIFMADIQNLFNRENVEQRRFEYNSGKVVVYDYKTIGRIPVMTIKIEF